MSGQCVAAAETDREEPSEVSYVIVGCGAIGGTLGHHLARGGHEVTVVDADAEHVRALRERGIVVMRGDERIAALADAPMAELIDRHPEVMHALAAEVYAVARAEGIALEPFDAFDPAPYASGDAAAMDAATHVLVAGLRTQAKDRSGIWRDIVVRHRPTEVPTHYRPVLGYAAQRGIAVPCLERLVAQIGELEAGAPMAEQRITDLAGALR
ncbi:MAG: hypothetical protein JWR58_2670 [Pseudonocardia sp.]|nr:hypothetical protein [Pseudonocardia sp.]